MQYRPDIDGLRTLAIVPVILYHLKIPFGTDVLMTGGFLGVDVFFVLSGYLITALLLRELQDTGRVNIWGFYQRRARRILPALLLVIFASLIAGWWLLLPSELERLALSALAALGFVSNIYWYFELGQYGAQSGLLQPLLHTWSLAIEEQFYLVFPLVLWALAPARRPGLALSVLAACALLSLALSEAHTQLDRELSFFSPVSRAWELLAGALLALVVAKRPGWASAGACLPAGLARALPKMGLATLLGAMWVIDLPQVTHPGLVTLPVILATLALIWSADPKEAVTRLLSSGPMVLIGKLSYSLYLWHFPVFAFGRLTLVDAPGPADMAAWVALTVLLSAAGYYLIERPFRFALSGRALAGSIAASLAALGAVVWTVLATDLSDRGRTADLAEIYGVNQYDNSQLVALSWSILDALAGPDETVDKNNARGPSRDEATRLWFPEPDGETINVLVVGNSHSKDMFNALHLAQDALPGFAFARFGMATGFPDDQRAALYAAPNFAAADIVLISTRYGRTDTPASFETRLPILLSELQARGKPVALVGNTPEFIPPGSRPIFDWFVQRYPDRARDPAQLAAMNPIAWGSRSSDVPAINARLRAIAEASGAVYLERADLICPAQDKICVLATPDGRKTMYDYGHWTLEGADWFGHRAAQIGWLEPLRSLLP